MSSLAGDSLEEELLREEVKEMGILVDDGMGVLAGGVGGGVEE